MANQEHLEILAKGVEAWNEWRTRNITVMPDLSHADLSRLDLTAADLSGAELRETDLHGVNMRGANLRGAHLYGSVLRGAQMVGADLRATYLMECCLSGANASGADFANANLRGADLSQTNLTSANLRRSDLCAANFKAAIFGHTSLSDLDLSMAINLADVRHDGPCTIGIDTIYTSLGQIPESFLRGCGVPENFITFMKSLTGAALEYYSCFISYSTKDQEFADRLHADLQANGVRCWFAPHDVQGGRKLHEQIDEAIRVHDKLLLVLSEASMNSPWVNTEIANARARQAQQSRQILFPISLVPFEYIRSWKCFDADTGTDSAREIREYYVPDFSNWKDRDTYQRAFDRLVRDLKARPSEKSS